MGRFASEHGGVTAKDHSGSCQRAAGEGFGTGTKN